MDSSAQQINQLISMDSNGMDGVQKIFYHNDKKYISNISLLMNQTGNIMKLQIIEERYSEYYQTTVQYSSLPPLFTLYFENLSELYEYIADTINLEANSCGTTFQIEQQNNKAIVLVSGRIHKKIFKIKLQIQKQQLPQYLVIKMNAANLSTLNKQLEDKLKLLQQISNEQVLLQKQLLQAKNQYQIFEQQNKRLFSILQNEDNNLQISINNLQSLKNEKKDKINKVTSLYRQVLQLGVKYQFAKEYLALIDKDTNGNQGKRVLMISQDDNPQPAQQYNRQANVNRYSKQNVNKTSKQITNSNIKPIVLFRPQNKLITSQNNYLILSQNPIQNKSNLHKDNINKQKYQKNNYHHQISSKILYTQSSQQIIKKPTITNNNKINKIISNHNIGIKIQPNFIQSQHINKYKIQKINSITIIDRYYNDGNFYHLYHQQPIKQISYIELYIFSVIKQDFNIGIMAKNALKIERNQWPKDVICWASCNKSIINQLKSKKIDLMMQIQDKITVSVNTIQKTISFYRNDQFVDQQNVDDKIINQCYFYYETSTKGNQIYYK